jgi:hypothetical protein
MASPGELVKVIASALGEDDATVMQHDRNLLIAGLRTKGGRGRSAAKVTAHDAAILLTSVLGSHRVRDGVDTVRRYLQTQERYAYWHQYFPERIKGTAKANVWENFNIPELAALPLKHTFIDAITALITLAAQGRLVQHLGEFYAFEHLRIGMTWPRTHGRISMHYFNEKDDSGSVEANYGLNEPSSAWIKDIRGVPRREGGDVSPKLDRWTETHAMPFLYIGALLAGKLEELPRIASATEAIAR